MLTLSADSINSLFTQACAAILEHGRDVAPRGMRTREVLGAWLCLTSPRRRVLDVPPRVINPAFAAAEAVWILSGSDDPWIYEYNRRLTAYTDDGRLQGAYGPRLRSWGRRGERPTDDTEHVDQLEHVISLLHKDPDSRQALVQLFNPGRDHRGYRDVPCTLGWRFYLREGRLHLHTTMRSQDLWLGFPYDVFTFTLMQELVAGWLGVSIGDYHHHVDSLHLYEQHWAPATAVGPHRAQQDPAARPCPPMEPVAVAWTEFDPLLHALVATRATPPALGRTSPPLPAGWTQIAAIMTSYRAWKHGDRETARSQAAAEPGTLTDALIRWYEHLTPPLTRSTGARERQSGSVA